MQIKVTKYEKIKKIIDKWDPIELLSMHCPTDEYDLESKRIAESFSEEITVNEFGKVIYEVFSESFGKNTFNQDLNECVHIAEKN